jgi:hypothetical protein
MLLVGLEGIWGFLICLVLLPIFQTIQCSPGDLCPYGRLEDTTRAFQDLAANPLIAGLSVIVCFNIAIFN